MARYVSLHRMPRPLFTSKFPAPGSVFLMPLVDRRFGVCRLIRTEPLEKEKGLKALVVASSWIGHEAPALNDAAILQTLVLTHHSWNGRKESFWVFGPPPGEFKLL